MLQERGEETKVACQSVNLGDDECGVLTLAMLKGFLEFLSVTVRTLATFNLRVFSDDIPIPTIQMVVDDVPLRLKPKTALALALR